MEEICDKCGKNKASCFHSSSRDGTISLCRQCNKEYDIFMWEAEVKFFGREIRPRPNPDKALNRFFGFGLPEINIGDKVKCLNCNKTIELNNETFKIGYDAEYICCPHCKSKTDVQYYHLIGKKVED